MPPHCLPPYYHIISRADLACPALLIASLAQCHSSLLHKSHTHSGFTHHSSLLHKFHTHSGLLHTHHSTSAPTTACCRRKALGLPEEIRLLPSSDDDAANAALAFYAKESRSLPNQGLKRKAILQESIFSSRAMSGAGASTSGGSAAAAVAGGSSRLALEGQGKSAVPASAKQLTAGKVGGAALLAAASLGSSSRHGGLRQGSAAQGTLLGKRPATDPRLQGAVGSKINSKTLKEKAALLAKRRQLPGVGLRLTQPDEHV